MHHILSPVPPPKSFVNVIDIEKENYEEPSLVNIINLQQTP